jgi:hypothetical protein
MQLCIYCQTNPEETVDHVPPKGMFKRPRPANLITVPACFRCNNGFSRDNEYLMNLALDWEASASSDGREVADKRLRAMRRKEGQREWGPIFAKLKAVEVYSRSGLYLANSFELSLDTARLVRMVDRIIKGLYFEVTKTPLPIGDYVRSMLFSHYVEKHEGESKAMEFINSIRHLPGRVIGDGVFGFRYGLLDRSRFMSFWYLEFYQWFAFLAITGKQDDPQLYQIKDPPLLREEAREGKS